MQQACDEVLRTRARSFRWASLFLPQDQRDDAAVVYAFCRAVDDAVDRTSDRHEAYAALGDLERDLERKQPRLPVVDAFVRVASRRAIDRVWARRLMAGVGSDIGPVRVVDDRQLLRYCYDVAGTVGLMMSALMGVRDSRAAAHAIDLGIAMQLTNICRDVAEDAQRDRVYLPASRLPDGTRDQQRIVQGAADTGAVSGAVRQLLLLAESYYDSGSLGMRYIPPRPRLAIMTAVRLYRAIGRRLLRSFDGNPLAGRVVVPWPEKALHSARATAGWPLTLITLSGVAVHRGELHQHLEDLPGVSAGANAPAEIRLSPN